MMVTVKYNSAEFGGGFYFDQMDENLTQSFVLWQSDFLSNNATYGGAFAIGAGDILEIFVPKI